MLFSSHLILFHVSETFLFCLAFVAFALSNLKLRSLIAVRRCATPTANAAFLYNSSEVMSATQSTAGECLVLRFDFLVVFTFLFAALYDWSVLSSGVQHCPRIAFQCAAAMSVLQLTLEPDLDRFVRWVLPGLILSGAVRYGMVSNIPYL